MKNKRGITLVALIITIIVMIILAGVAISLVTGDSGVLNQAEVAGEKQNYATAQERIQAQCHYITEGKNAGKVNLEETEKNIINSNFEEVKEIIPAPNLLTIVLNDGSKIEIPGISESNKDIEYYKTDSFGGMIQKVDYNKSESITYVLNNNTYNKQSSIKFSMDSLNENVQIKLYGIEEWKSINSGSSIAKLEVGGNIIVGAYFQNNIMYGAIIESSEIVEEITYEPFYLVSDETEIIEIESKIQ